MSQTDPPTDDALTRLTFDLGPNEASGLEDVTNQRVLADHGWDVAFWAVLDDVDVTEAIRVLGHRADEPLDEGWETDQLETDCPAHPGPTEDAEAVTGHDGRVYVFGSHFGSKDGPLQRERQFVARFREGDADEALDGRAIELDIERTGLRDGLHAVINDALLASGVDLTAPGKHTRDAFLGDVEEPEDMRVRASEHPINVEGAEFLSDGSLFLGLRWPVEASGEPLIVALRGVPEWLDGDVELPEVTAVHVVDAIGRDGTVAGVRDLAVSNGRLHVVTGNIDSRDKGSVLLEDVPEGAGTVNTHFETALPSTTHDQHLEARVVREFPDLPRIEGIAFSGGHVFYASDEDEGVDVRYSRFLIG